MTDSHKVSPTPPADPGLRPLMPSGFEVASYGKRLLAFVIDMVLLVMAMTLLVQYIGLTDFDPSQFKDAQAMQAAFIEKIMSLDGNKRLTLALGPYVFFFIAHGFLLTQYGQTLGKRILGIAIVTLDNRKPEFLPLIAQRYLPQWILGGVPLIGPVLRVVDVLFLFNDSQNCCLHDKLAKTKVVDLSKPLQLTESTGPRQATLEV